MAKSGERKKKIGYCRFPGRFLDSQHLLKTTATGKILSQLPNVEL